jgi:hypothetical protein
MITFCERNIDGPSIVPNLGQGTLDDEEWC